MWEAQEGDHQSAMVKTPSPWDWATATLYCARYWLSHAQNCNPLTKLCTHALEEMLNMTSCPLLKNQNSGARYCRNPFLNEAYSRPISALTVLDMFMSHENNVDNWFFGLFLLGYVNYSPTLDLLVISYLSVTGKNAGLFSKSVPTINNKVLKHPEQNLSLKKLFKALDVNTNLKTNH